jgi:hypothetical protein
MIERVWSSVPKLGLDGVKPPRDKQIITVAVAISAVGLAFLVFLVDSNRRRSDTPETVPIERLRSARCEIGASQGRIYCICLI